MNRIQIILLSILILVGLPTNPTTTVAQSPANGLEPGDEALVRPSLRVVAVDDIFYFVMPDRFENGDPGNDTAHTPGGAIRHGFRPSDKGYYHGGDLAGLRARLDYLNDGDPNTTADLGITALWLTPMFKNRWVQGDGTLSGSTAAYHGYWQLDFTQIDPHFGSNADMIAFIAEAHDRGIKVFFDIVINHTADVIGYQHGGTGYRSKTDFPYRDAEGNPFDDAPFANDPGFPPLDLDSFPYRPVFATPADANAKKPAWLNDRRLYHNRGNSTFSGESSLYGDFFGLDDLFTERPVVVQGMIDLHRDMISTFDIDGFRIDTVKHVNTELWQAFVPAIREHAVDLGKPNFFIFGEVFDGNPAFLSHFTGAAQLPAVLDFGFQGQARAFASQSAPTHNLRDFFAGDDWYIDADSNAYILPTFLGNHDMGRFGFFLRQDHPAAADAELVARAKLGHALMYFARGMPVVYYGDEQGFTGDGGDKDARQDMFPSQVASYNDDPLLGTDATTAESNFDPDHPIFRALKRYATLLTDHPTLRRGAQLHRLSGDGPSLYAFSRIDRAARIEYLIAFNNAPTERSAAVPTGSPATSFSQIYPGGGSALTSDAEGRLTLTVPGLDFVIYRADQPLPESEAAPGIVITSPAADAPVSGRIEVGAQLDRDLFAEVTFARSIDGGPYEVIGSDDNAPYRVFYEVDQHPPGTALTFKAIVDDLSGHLNAAKQTVVVAGGDPPLTAPYAIIHYQRAAGDYGDHSSPNFNDFWGLHLWDDIDETETMEWTAPKPFLGEDDYGRFAWVKLAPNAANVGFIVHQGDTKDGTSADRFFNPARTPEIWLKEDDPMTYHSQAEAQGFVTIHYQRPDGRYGGWGLHLWGEAITEGAGTSWDAPRSFDGVDGFGAYWRVPIQDAGQPVNFIIHNLDNKDPGPDQHMLPAESAHAWIVSGDETVYAQQGAAEGFALIHYHRADGDYGDPSSSDFDDFWGLHLWNGAASPNPDWQIPHRWEQLDTFGPVFKIDLAAGAAELAYIIHRGDHKDPGPDQFLNLDQSGYEVWQLEGADVDNPYLRPLPSRGGPRGNLKQQQAYWVTADTIAWAVPPSPAARYQLHVAVEGGLTLDAGGVSGGQTLDLTVDPAGLSEAVTARFPHLAGLTALKLDPADRAKVPQALRGQVAVSAMAGNRVIDATGLQIPGVLDDLYPYAGPLGPVINDDDGLPSLHLWAPTAQSVTLHRFADADPATPAITHPMRLDAETGVWSITGEAEWLGQYYRYEVTVYVPATGRVERNLVTDPYAISLAANSARSQLIDLADPAWMPPGWETLQKPALAGPQDISIYELHLRDFSWHDSTVPEPLRGTYLAFTQPDSDGMRHLTALADAGLTHLHLLPIFDIATVEERREAQQQPAGDLSAFPPDSPEQQAAISAVAAQDGFNWGYDPWHYTVPEGSYATDPEGAARILEFRRMVQALNQAGLRMVMDVVYNHTNAAGQDPKSVLDRIVPGYYHRLNADGQVETSTCCQNTATEHAIMEKLMIDSVLTWAKFYRIDGFRFDLMGHHSKANMLNLRAALDGLTPAQDGVDGSQIYLYGEGWNFGEVVNGTRFEQATQLNMAGTGIGTFNDRLRDAIRGGGPFDGGAALIANQGFSNGLYTDPNANNSAGNAELAQLYRLTDQIRIGLTGNLADYELLDWRGRTLPGRLIDYNGSPTGYTQDPQEQIAYAAAHDNQTLYDNNVYKLPLDTSPADRARVQNLGIDLIALSQGVPFFHAGMDMLRSKSLDRDSFDSGDWFNMLDFSYADNNFGVGLPPEDVNGDNWPLMQPLLANPALRPAPAQIEATAIHLREMLAIRRSSRLFRLESGEAVKARLRFHNTGPGQIPGLIAMSITSDDDPTLDPAYRAAVVIFNATPAPQTLTLPDFADRTLALHPVQAASPDALVRTARVTNGVFTIPARTTAVFMEGR